MRALFLGFLLPILGHAAAPPPLNRPADREEAFLRSRPRIGDTLPDLTVYTPEGKEVKLSSLRGHHVVLTFGCLT